MDNSNLTTPIPSISVMPGASTIPSTSLLCLFGLCPISTMDGRPVILGLPLKELNDYPGQNQMMTLNVSTGFTQFPSEVGSTCIHPAHHAEGIFTVRHPLFQPGGLLEFEKLTPAERTKLERIADQIEKGIHLVREAYDTLLKFADHVSASRR